MRVGNGDFMYEFIPNWGRPPAGYEFGGVPGGAVDGWGRVHVFTRTRHPVLIFDADGKLSKSWGEPGTGPGEFSIVHTLCVAKNGTVYVSDRENYRIQLFSPDGDFLAEKNASNN